MPPKKKPAKPVKPEPMCRLLATGARTSLFPDRVVFRFEWTARSIDVDGFEDATTLLATAGDVGWFPAKFLERAKVKVHQEHGDPKAKAGAPGAGPVSGLPWKRWVVERR